MASRSASLPMGRRHSSTIQMPECGFLPASPARGVALLASPSRVYDLGGPEIARVDRNQRTWPVCAVDRLFLQAAPGPFQVQFQ
ncbi:MAG: hypothetical protein U5J63_03960 [Fodinibius sp.]|nr:hypothetical protein [Fodinibius sp.]